jgi:crotonobetainyl-CoA:carnitine CoA-transferase CaiB-like acyl-CoA transferase
VLNRNKRSLALDLKNPAAAAVVKRLITAGGYDIILEQFRPGVMARLGLGYDILQTVNPSLIYCSVTGYGQTGPYRERAGHDNNYLALAGVMSHSGRKATGPTPWGVQVADIGGGAMGAVLGILTAVIHRSHSGQGQQIDISMFDMSIAWQAHVVSHYLVGGMVPEPESWQLNGGSSYDFYETSDGRYLSVGSLEPKFWQGFCTAVGRPDLIPRGFEPDLEKQQALKEEIHTVLAAKTLAEWLAIFVETDVCVEPVLTIPEMIAHPQTQARQMIVAVPKPDGTSQAQVASPFKFSETEARYAWVGGDLGGETTAVLQEVGYSAAEIEEMGNRGLFG